MAKETNEDRVDEDTPDDILPVTEARYLPGNLEACVMQPQDMTPEAFAQLEEAYGQAINSSPCPCGGGKTYGDCECKSMWWRARKAWKGRETPEDKRAKQDFRDQIDEQRRLDKEEAKVQVVARLGISATGDAVVLPVQGQDTYNLALVQAVCEEAARRLFIMMVSDQVHTAVGQLAAHLQKRLDEIGSMIKQGGGQTFRGL